MASFSNAGLELERYIDTAVEEKVDDMLRDSIGDAIGDSSEFQNLDSRIDDLSSDLNRLDDRVEALEEREALRPFLHGVDLDKAINALFNRVLQLEMTLMAVGRCLTTRSTVDNETAW